MLYNLVLLRKVKFCCAHIKCCTFFRQIDLSGSPGIYLIQTDAGSLCKFFVTDARALQAAEHPHCFVLYSHYIYLRFTVRAVSLFWIYFYQRNAERIKIFLGVPPTFTVGKYLFEIWRVLVPAAVNDNPTHSTLVESAIFPLPTFTGISLPDGFSFRFDTPKGEMITHHFVLFLRPHSIAAAVAHPY